MKILVLTLILFLLTFISNAQTYSTVITDQEISNFFLQVKKKLHIKKIDEEIRIWQDDDIYPSKDSLMNMFSWGGLLNNKFILAHFDQENLAFLEKQYKSIRDSIWRKKDFQQFLLIDTIEINNIYKRSMSGKRRVKDNHCYFFSIPLFSVNRQLVVVHQTYYCGSLCASTCIYIYRRKNNRKKWEEIAKWNCWEG